MLIFSILLWVLFCGMVSLYAWYKGLSFFELFLLSFFFSPLIGLVVAVIMKQNIPIYEKRQIKLGLARRCPHCAEVIKRRESVCPFCDKEVGTPHKGKKAASHRQSVVSR